MELAPIVLFVYNRPWHTKRCLEALSANELAKDSILYIYADGAKNSSNEKEIKNIEEVGRIITSKNWCKKTVVYKQKLNKGLAQSIIEGVTEIINIYKKVIVLEDDIITSHYFLKYMNESLRRFEHHSSIWHISGHSFPLKIKGLQRDYYFLRYVSPWGWATWVDRWKFFESDPKSMISKLVEFPDFSQSDFNSEFGQEFYNQLQKNVSGELFTWAVKWHTTIYLNRGLSIFPMHTLTQNIGFDGSGMHCPSDVWQPPVIDKEIIFDPLTIKTEPEIPALIAFKKYYKLTRNPSRIKYLYGRLQSILLGK